MLVVVIVIGIKLIFTMNKVDLLLDDVTKKVHSLDRVFNMIDYTTDKVTMISDTVVNFITSKLKRIIKFKKNDEEDEDEKPLFERAYRLLGPLAHDEMYGFVPAAALGGPRRLDHLQKVKAVEHLTLLSMLEPPKVMRDIVKEAKERGIW